MLQIKKLEKPCCDFDLDFKTTAKHELAIIQVQYVGKIMALGNMFVIA